MFQLPALSGPSLLRRAIQWVPALAAALLPLLLSPAAQAAERGLPRRPVASAQEDPNNARVIVRFRSRSTILQAQQASGGVGPQQAARMGQRLSLALRNGRTIDSQTQVLFGDKALGSAGLAALLAADPEVEFAVPDRRRGVRLVPTDPLYAARADISPAAGQWYLRAPDSLFVSAINAEGAWNITTGNPALVVADIDTGVLFGHPDLTRKLYAGYDFINDTATSGDGSKRDSDASDPGDWTAANECADGDPEYASSWHGTQTSSLIGAQSGNGLGMTGVGFNVMVLPVRVLGKCGGWDSDIQAGMLWAAGLGSIANPHPAKVLNLSLGGTGSCDADYVSVVNRILAAGVVIVAAAGNDVGLAVGVPANCPGVIAVSGVRHAGTKVGYSNIGPQVAVAAPAGNCVNLTGACLYPILTATNTGTRDPDTNTYSDSDNASYGTSFATPMVAGAAALMLSASPQLTPAQVKSYLMKTARPFPTTSTDPTVLACRAPTSREQSECICTTTTCGAGMLDVQAAVAAPIADRVFAWAESVYPTLFPRNGVQSGNYPPYVYRYYPQTGNYLGTANGRVVVHNGSYWNFADVGALMDYLPQAAAAGY